MQPVIYVIEDDDLSREALTLLLGTVGLPCHAFADVEAFLAGYDSQSVGCLILDHRLPGEMGLSALPKLRDKGCDLPVILVTAYSSVELCRRAFLAGAADFLPKPLDDEALLASVQAAVGTHRQQRREQAEDKRAHLLLARLTPREEDALRDLLRGLSSRQSAEHLGVSPRTVENHRSSVLGKLEAASALELALRFGKYVNNL